MLKSTRRFRAAGFCALAVLICELIARPFTTMTVGDDGPYIRMARTFATTGHIVYNGWAAAMMVSQIYLAQPFIKLFGDSYTSIRMSTLLVALVTAIIFQRLLVRTGASERNATLGTLAVVLSQMYLMLSVTFMSDIHGFFALVLCMYGCVRARQASSDRSAIGWICFAAFTCAAFGTSRQIAWLGALVMVPCTLWLLRRQTRVLLAGSVATALAFLFIFGCMHWLARQPYAASVPLLARPFPKRAVLKELFAIVLEVPFLVLPVIAVFAPRVFKGRRYMSFLFLAALVAYVAVAFHLRNDPNPVIRLEPTSAYLGGWQGPNGVFTSIQGAPIVLTTTVLVVLTVVCLAGLLGVIAVIMQEGGSQPRPLSGAGELSWKQMGILFLPFTAAYLLMLVSLAGTTRLILDRYALGLLGPAMIVLIRLYQERVGRSLPFATVLLVIVTGAYGTIGTHNTFALDRARVDLANELHADDVPFTSIDGGWEYNFDTELNNSSHLNYELVKVPLDGYVQPPPPPPAYCYGARVETTPHVQALYGITFEPDSCYGLAPFAPVQYRPWPLRKPVNIYAVRYVPPNAVASQEAAHGREQKNDDQQ